MLKVIIVDDERNIREGINFLVDWESLGCTVVASLANGSVALNYLKSNPVDIVVTDIKMPVMDGLELSSHIANEFKDTKVVILTAYSDFDMAKKAIKYGVEDFIIKNDFMEELSGVIKRIAAKIEEERASKKKYAQPAEAELIDLAGNRYCVCVCDIESMDENEGYNLVEMLKNILKISLKGCEYDIVSHKGGTMNIVVKYQPNSGININTVVEYFNNILIMVEEFMRITLRVGLSSESESESDYETLLNEAKDALAKIVSDESKLSVYVPHESGEESTGLVDVEKYKSNICEVVFAEDAESPKSILKEFGDELSEKAITFEQCQLYALVIYSAIIHKMVSFQLDVDMDFNKLEREIYKKIQDAKTLHGLLEVGNDLIDKLTEVMAEKKQVKNELVNRVDACIRANYKTDLNLNFISNSLYLNGSYVSRAYKKLTGITVTEKINLYRIGKAKELLANTNKKIYEVAEEVGFKDAAYFTNVFIKYVGVNPSEYRTVK